MRDLKRVIAWAVFLALAGGSLAAGTQAEPITGDCASCHAGEAVLPEGHVPTPEMTWEGCATCHVDSDAELNLAGAIPLSHLHGLRGVECDSCHGDSLDPVEDGTCEACHGSLESLAQSEWPEGRGPNPHDSHYPGLNCTFCHHAHQPSEDFCLQCHDFGYQIP